MKTELQKKRAVQSARQELTAAIEYLKWEPSDGERVTKAVEELVLALLEACGSVVRIGVSP